MADDIKDFTSDAPWAAKLAHKPDPNRVGSLQTPSIGTSFERPENYLPPDPATSTAALVPAKGEAKARDPNLPKLPEPSYYDISPLKSSLWKWEIAVYFFLGGVSAGTFILGRMNDRVGGPKALTRAASTLSFLSLLPCPPLLIHDLGDPKRFHHMLRVFKPSSPMSLGTWVITSYSGAATSEFARHFLTGPNVQPGDRTKLQKMLNNGTLLLVQDAAGVPLALMLASYTAVLLSTSSNPLWSKNAWMGPLFVASAVATSCEAITLALDAKKTAPAAETPAIKGLRRLDTMAHLIEMACMVGFNKHAGEKAATLHTGKLRHWHKASIAGVVGSEAVKLLPLPKRLHKSRRILSGLLGLTGGFALRWSMVLGGVEAGNDPHAARLVGNQGDRA